MHLRLLSALVVVVAMAAGCGRCGRPALPWSGEEQGLIADPGPVPELAAPGPAEPTGAPVLTRRFRLGPAGAGSGRVVLAIDPAGTRLAASGTWLRRRSFEVEASALTVWRLDGLEEELTLSPGTFIDALALGPGLVAFGGGYRDRFDVVRLPGKERQEVALGLQGPRPWLARLAVDSDGTRLAACVNYTDDVLVWTLPALAPVMTGRHGFECEHLAFSADGKELAVRYALGRNRVWDLASAAPVRAFADRHVSEFTWSDSSPSGRLLATATDADPEVALWDTRSGRRVGSLPAAAPGGPYALRPRFHPAGHLLVTAEGLGQHRLTLWRLDTGAALATWAAPHQEEVSALAFTPDGRTLVTASGDGEVLVWRWP